MKLKIRSWLIAVCIFSLLGQASAQNFTVTGKVSRKAGGDVLNGASVALKGTKTASSTDATGSFTIAVPAGGGTLMVSYVGMATQERKVTKAGEVTFELEESAANSLNDVIVVGYGTQKVTKVSGAISSIKSADIEKLKPVRVEEALQGRASGVNVIQSGSPGSTPTITIRGIPSYAGNGPLVVIDGIQQSQSDLNSINPSDIESINVLKDAASAAIYGVAGGNGVLVVTTKTGRKNQKTEMTLTSNVAIQEVMNTLPMLNASEYGAIINEGSVASGGNIIFNDLSKLGVGTNWQDEIFERALFQTHNISARGGGEKMSYFLGGGYLSQGGIVGGYDKSRFNRANFTANLNFDLTKKLKFIVNGTYLNLNSRGVKENAFNSIIGNAVNFDPTVSKFNTVPNTVGQYGFSTLQLSEVFNPLTVLENTYNTNNGGKLYGKFEFQYEVIKNLRISTRFGYTKYDGNAKTFTPLVFYGINNVDNSMNADGSAVTGKFNSVGHEKASYSSFNYELFGNYNFDLGSNHSFDVVAGLTLAKSSGNTAGASRQGVPYNSWDFADFTAATGNNSGTNTEALKGYYYQYFKRNLSYFGRVNYDFQEKYLASATVRRDGSTAFGKDNKFGLFTSGSLGWVVTKEKFFQSKFINFLKIRGSYGTLGSDNTKPQYSSIQTDYLASLYGAGNSIGYTFGNNFYSGASLGSYANDELSWEKQVQANVGFEMNFFKNKFNISADYYEKRTNGLLFVTSASSYLGAVPIPTVNIGSTKGSGLDISLGYNDKLSKNLTISTSLAVTTVKSLVTKTSEDGSAWIFSGNVFNGQATIFAPNYAPATYFGYKTDGLFQSTGDIAKAPVQAGAQPGDIKFVDVNKDGVIDANDRTQIGNPFPKVTLGWNLNLTYKNIDFTAFTYASIGNDVYRAFERNSNYTNKFQDVLDRWTGPGTTNNARNPRYSFTDPNNNSRISDRYVDDGSFIKIKNIQLGYNITGSAIKNIFKGIRVYAQVKNAYTFTNYTGFDPEVPAFGLLDTGIDRGSYPQARTYALGVDVKF